MRILLVEDDRKLAAGIAKSLKAEDFSVDHAYDGVEGEQCASVNHYDAIILDIRLPKQDGFTTCSNLRNRNICTPILFLTAVDEVADKVKGLNCGGDDYLTKPFSTAELVARIHALGRRPVQVRLPVMNHFGVTLDTASHQVHRDGEEIFLSVKEFALLELFMKHPGEIIAREMIIDTLWDIHSFPQSNVVDALVKLLRMKMDNEDHTSLIHTVRGVGFKFDGNEE
jgi:two-component system OmpR family response regulator